MPVQSAWGVRPNPTRAEDLAPDPTHRGGVDQIADAGLPGLEDEPVLENGRRYRADVDSAWDCDDFVWS